MPFKNPHPLYSIWNSMKVRCNNKNFSQYFRYGGRGITVCPRWLEYKSGFYNFLSDMGERPKGYTLDRINNDGNYEPSNCKWSTHTQQQRNQSVTRKVTIEGITYIAAELSEKYGLKTDTIVNRVNKNMSFLQVISLEKYTDLNGLSLGAKARGLSQKTKTHCPQGHLYSKENTSISKQGFRSCKTCHKEKEAARRKLPF